MGRRSQTTIFAAVIASTLASSAVGGPFGGGGFGGFSIGLSRNRAMQFGSVPVNGTVNVHISQASIAAPPITYSGPVVAIHVTGGVAVLPRGQERLGTVRRADVGPGLTVVDGYGNVTVDRRQPLRSVRVDLSVGRGG
jgi:hypothetical protein